MVDTVDFNDIVDKLSSGAQAAVLINDSKRAINEVIVEGLVESQEQSVWNTGTDTTESAISPAKLDTKLANEISAIPSIPSQIQATWGAGTSSIESTISPLKLSDTIAELGGGAKSYRSMRLSAFDNVNTDEGDKIRFNSTDSSLGSDITYNASTYEFTVSGGIFVVYFMPHIALNATSTAGDLAELIASNQTKVYGSSGGAFSHSSGNNYLISQLSIYVVDATDTDITFSMELGLDVNNVTQATRIMIKGE